MDATMPRLKPTEVSTSLVEVRGARFLEIRSARGYHEPLAGMTLRAGCQGGSNITREFVILLDPAPLRSVPTASTPLAAPTLAADGAQSESRGGPPTSGTNAVRWTANAGDTLEIIAKRAFPQSRSRRRAYLAALRELNPSLSGVADSAELIRGSEVVLPPRQEAKSATKPSLTGLAPAIPAEGIAARRARQDSAKIAGSTRKRNSGERFSLRLSGGEIDLSRSAGVSEETRNQLREKQMLLDADDQVAQLLSLKNTVKQLESRLNELQLKLSTPASEGAAGMVVRPGPASSVAPPPSAPASAAAPNNISAASNPAAGAQVPAGPSTNWVIVAPVMLLAVVMAWLLSRRRAPREAASNSWISPLGNEIEDRVRTAEPMPASDPATEGAAAQHAFDQAEAERDAALLLAIRGKRSERQAPEIGIAAPPAPAVTPVPDFSATIKMPAAPRVDPPAGRFELPAAPLTAVDFPLEAGDPADQDRFRRLRYMHERFPELATHTVSIDDTDSVINAARLHYEEGEDKAARDKACEMLNFAIEERPQEIRFWLAQFEIYRLDQAAAEFTELATKFHLLFSHTEAWPKVRHIGYELDPANPLFAAAGRAAEAGMRFDPAIENWLNSPMDFSINALVGELRSALFKDHGVESEDFDAISTRLSAGSSQALTS
jgi:hypothetical protein